MNHWKLAARRFALAILVSIVVAAITVLAGVPTEIGRAIGGGAALTVFFAGVYPHDDPHRGRKNVILWGAHFAFFAGGYLLMNWWRGV